MYQMVFTGKYVAMGLSYTATVITGAGFDYLDFHDSREKYFKRHTGLIAPKQELQSSVARNIIRKLGWIADFRIYW